VIIVAAAFAKRRRPAAVIEPDAPLLPMEDLANGFTGADATRLRVLML
jgi:hypothetical protein